MIRAALRHAALTIRLYFRNPLAMTYGYLFPVVFLLAFWALYRDDRVPLIRHVGELLTVNVLGGACFGLPATIVSERERGVWRRYRLAPVLPSVLVASSIAARYVIVTTAAVLQLALAMTIGMPLPVHAIQLWGAFTIVAFAFLGCGLVIAMVADTVPAVQALGQTIFLPMLIIGGVAVPLASLPGWAQHASAFLPGRYAVEILQACAAGDGLAGMSFNATALIVIGAAACLAGAMMFRWDEHERFIERRDRGWIAVAMAAWVAVGLTAEWRGDVPRNSGQAYAPSSIHTLQPTRAETAAGAQPAAFDAAVVPSPKPAASPSRRLPASWTAVTDEDIKSDLKFDQLPPDAGIITPIASASDQPDPATAESLTALTQALSDWEPASVADPVQRARNLLYVAADADLLESDLEKYVPAVVFDRLQTQFDRSDLVRILYWIALHPFDGDDSAAADVAGLGLRQPAASAEDIRARAAVYGVKLLGRLAGRISDGR